MAAKLHKADLYAKELDRARLKGEWSDAAGPHVSGKQLAWSELIRKYSKHNSSQPVISQTAALEQQLRSSLTAFWQQQGYTDLAHESDSALPKSGNTLFPPTLPLNKQGDGWSGPKFEVAAAELEVLADKAGSHDGLKQGIVAIHSFALFSMGKDEEAVGLLHESHFLEKVNTDEVRPEEQNDQYQTALFIMGFVTYGMANERLHRGKPSAGYLPFAHAGYARAIELHEEVRGGKRAKALPGLPEDEIERWAETALYRNALLSVRESDASLGLNALRAYQAHVARWPKDFRLPQRNVINRTYLRVLNAAIEAGNYATPPAAGAKSRDDWRSQAYQRAVVANVASRLTIRDYESERAGKHGISKRAVGIDAKAVASRTVSKRRPHPHRVLRPSSAAWSNEMQTVSRSAAVTVEHSSEFPWAGKVNTSALLLADELVHGWQLNGELGGEHADDLVESLYTLSRLTFHSQRISRHLFTVLTAAQAYEESRCALELYVSIVEKARQGDAAASAALVEESKLREDEQNRKAQDDGSDPGEKETVPRQGQGLSDEAKQSANQVSLDADDDAIVADTYIHGAYILCKYLDDPAAGAKLAEKALHLLPPRGPQARLSSTSGELVARVLRVAGQCKAARCCKDPRPSEMQKLQGEALALLRESVELDSQASEGWYQLAYLQGQMRDISSGIRSARKVIELEPADVQAWHLLVLLVSAQKDFQAAFKLAEVALDEAEVDDEADAQAASGKATQSQAVETIVNSTSTGDVNANGSAGGATVSEARTQLLSVDFPPSAAERAEAILQLMMTQNALEEIVAGTEAAIESQKETFEFFHKNISFHIQPVAASAPGRAAPVSAAASLLSVDGVSHTVFSSSNGAKGTKPSHRLLTFSRKQGKLSGLGQSGASSDHSASPNGVTTLQSSASTSSVSGPVAAVVPPASGSNALGAFGGNEPRLATPEDCRRAYQLQQEVRLLCGLWLMSAASFRRAGRLDESRAAIQEAERLDPSSADVWVQLALLSEKTGSIKLAVGSLYKALACQEEHLAATVHLARLFLQDDTGEAVAASSERRASAASVPAPDGATPQKTESREEGGAQAESAAEVKTSPATRSLSSLSLAEGLLVSVTSAGRGWDCPQAWLYLAQVCERTGRRDRARECLRWGLTVESGAAPKTQEQQTVNAASGKTGATPGGRPIRAFDLALR